jgi:L-fucose isomerase-like protein
MEQLTAGYVPFGTQYYMPENLAMISARAEAQLHEAGVALVRTDPVFGEGHEPERAIQELKAAPWDFLIVAVLNWVEVRGVMRVLLEFRDKPMILYSFGGFTKDGTLICPAAGAGCTALRFPMERMGFRFAYLFNAPDSPMDIAGILAFGRAARAARLLRGARLGMVGWNDMGLLSTDFSTVRLRDRIGPEVESVDLLQLERRMQALDGEVVAAETRRVTADWEYPVGAPSPEALDRVIRLYLATVGLCREKGFVGFSYKCVDGVDSCLGVTHAVPASLVASAGYAYVDENDVGNLVAELMLKYVSGGQVMFLEHYDHHPEWILLGEDGYAPDQMIEGRPRIKVVTTVAMGGVAHCSRLKLGRMTLACLAEDDDGHRLHIVSGEGREPPRWVEMGVPLPSWPSVKFFPDVPVRRILDHVQSQHFAMAYGDHVEELRHLCRLLGIRAIVDARE